MKDTVSTNEGKANFFKVRACSFSPPLRHSSDVFEYSVLCIERLTHTRLHLDLASSGTERVTS